MQAAIFFSDQPPNNSKRRSMRAILATLFLLLCACAVPATGDAHAGHHRRHASAADMLGPGLIHMLQSMERPRAWCGWYMRQVEAVADPAYNRAANWAHYGRPASGPQPGVIVVWPHHVGVIRGGPDGAGEWLVESGNDGNAVRTRFRSLRGAIAFRTAGAWR
jgi:hypothetical protein